MGEIESIYRYPIKGLSAEKLSTVMVEKGSGFAFDRYWAIENGTEHFDPNHLKFLPKKIFLQLARIPKLAQLKCQFLDGCTTFVICHDGKELVRSDMTDEKAATAIEECIAEFLDQEAAGKLRLVSASGHHFSDIPEKAISLINNTSVAEISMAAGKEVSPQRFRGNIYVDGFKAWAEMDWVGKTIKIDDVPMFEVFSVTGRCPATKVNLETGERDVETLDVLNDTFGHTKCGVYMMAIGNGAIKPGGVVTVS